MHTAGRAHADHVPRAAGRCGHWATPPCGVRASPCVPVLTKRAVFTVFGAGLHWWRSCLRPWR